MRPADTHRFSLYGSGMGIFENTGNKCNDRLILLKQPGERIVPGSGLGHDETRLINKIPAAMVVELANKEA